ncbi:prepilin-type cleavage/methylation domain-containing protein [Photobacterium profundum]|uniref:Type 4 fimbrial PilA n=1 Tax=Photobacterium profundum 3TCK TaxID=314280 RepID=Q1Z4K2_9GAMM|nr:pilin [Photobacterium profundum]EAS43347.1 type 4 fimbrial precursor PilA [Photobacterium profundum 3TCK]PSV60332.1 prepilin-type cleavage/methylation domain-containing protein [Photobacterium profundum]
MKKVQKGFTLIELMIVVAVIGVLSAIAVPQYQKYVAKSEAASALATVAGLKTNIETAIAETGTFPSLTATDAGNAQYGVPKVTTGTIAFVGAEDAANGAVNYLFTKGKASVELVAKTLTLTRDTSGNWACTVNFGSSTDTALIPKNCIFQ